MRLRRRRNDRIQSVHISVAVIECCADVKRWMDLHRVDRCVPSSSQHDTDLEVRVRERMLKETAVVSEFGRRGGECDTDTDRDCRFWRLLTPLVLPVAEL